MPRRPRMYLPGMVYEVTSRTRAGAYSMRPCAKSTELILGVIGRAMSHYPSVRLHVTNPISTHDTALLSAADPSELPKFIGFVKANISKELRRLHGLDSGIFTGVRASVIPVHPDTASLESRFNYVMAQGTKEDLVESPRDWPGVTTVHALESGAPLHGWWFDRTEEAKARRRDEKFDKYKYATRYPIRVTRLPCWDHLNESEWRARVTEIVADIIAREGDRRSRDHRTVLGAEAVMAVRPTYVPAELACSPAPLFHAVGKTKARAMRRLIYDYCVSFAAASAARRAGEPNAEFPPFSIPPGSPMTPGARSAPLDLVLPLAPEF